MLSRVFLFNKGYFDVKDDQAMSAKDWADLLGNQDAQDAARDVLNAPFTDDEYDQAINQEMSDINSYYLLQDAEPAPPPVAPADDKPAAEPKPEPKKPAPPAVKLKDPAERHLELLQIVRKENKEKLLGLDQSGITIEASRRLRAEVEAGKVADPALKDYDPGEYVLKTAPDYYNPVIEGMLNRRTINEINGDAGAGKTTLLVQMAVSLAMGTPLFNCFRVAKRGVTVFFTEDPDSVEMQVAAWALKTGVNLREWIKVFKRPADLMEPSKLRIQKARIENFAAGRPVNMLVFDSKMFHLSAANNNGVSMDENSNTDQQLITTAGHRFAESLDAAGIFIPHVSKGQLLSGNYDLDSRGGSAAKGAVYKTFSLVRERVQSGKGDRAVVKDTGYTVLSVGKARQGGLKGRFKLKGYQVPVFAGDTQQAKLAKYEACFEEGQEVNRPDFIRIDDASHVWIFEDEVFDMSAGHDEEYFEAEEKRQSHSYTPLQEAIYGYLRSQASGTTDYKTLMDTIYGTVFKNDNTRYSKEAIRAGISKMQELGHIKREANPDEARNPWLTIIDCATPEMGSCAGPRANY